MKVLGFNCTKESDGYLAYENDGTKHYNKDYNTECPEPRGKVIININLNYGCISEKFSQLPFMGIYNDGNTRTSYHGVIPSEEFLITLLNSVR